MKTFKEFITEAEVPLCTGTRGSEIILKYPNTNDRYYYDMGLVDVALKISRSIAKFGIGRYINKIKQYPVRVVEV